VDLGLPRWLVPLCHRPGRVTRGASLCDILPMIPLPVSISCKGISEETVLRLLESESAPTRWMSSCRTWRNMSGTQQVDQARAMYLRNWRWDMCTRSQQ
jgi:hypothetical protein